MSVRADFSFSNSSLLTEHNTLSFIGGGNLARALIAGLRKNDFPEAQIVVSNRGREKLMALARDFGIVTADDNVKAAEKADILVIAVKPQDVELVVNEIRGVVKTKHPLVISLAAGITMETLDRWFECPLSIVRTMPNTANLIGKGITVLYANPSCSEAQKTKAEHLFQLSGVATWVKNERDIDLMTPFVGSSIAYLFIFTEAMQQAAIKTGIDPAVVHELSLQTIYGAVSMAMQSKESFDTMISHVATRGGVTEPSLEMIRTGGLFQSMEQAFVKVADRCTELSDQLSKADAAKK